ncbi:hypothetical protein [Deinococcus marmoris]|uniref:Uncharacterized protein n=1 Tax=Deinococcus marmoris TaxID=249408 RepID=A0A1U7P4P5_9DEIO|nr:hypothetical protein [Deinococcus marmoris]OLV20144.1 hypothetical protein BOO71_0000460 [Deinococcus marmoris]
MSLPDLLMELAELLPERFSVRSIPVRTYHVTSFHGRVDGNREYLGCTSTMNTLDQPGESWQQRVALEGALREECDERGWEWAIYRSGKTYRAALYRNPGQDSTEVEDVDDVESEEPSPAEALAAVVLDALKASADS